MLFSKSLLSCGIDSRGYGILVTLTNHHAITQIKIGELMSIDRTTVGQLIDMFETKGFVKREQNPKDRRQNLVVLTNVGQNLVREKWEEMRQIERSVISNLSDWQKEVFISITKESRGKNNG